VRPIRIETALENIEHDERIKEAMKFISWDFRSLIGCESDTIRIMCEMIMLGDGPIPPPGFSVDGASIDRILETWQTGKLRHYLAILSIKSKAIADFFKQGDVGILAGSNLTRSGIVIQLAGSQKSVMKIVKSLKESIVIDRVSLSHGSKGMVESGPTLQQLKILKNAHKHGWYDTPKKVSIRELSNLMGISKSSIAEQLVKAEEKVVGSFINRLS
jgi:hypothetical protein|tara:strand:- start:472 stop:1119 length:648 start_codon:yes stop_codon:yes gene_type:complete